MGMPTSAARINAVRYGRERSTAAGSSGAGAPGGEADERAGPGGVDGPSWSAIRRLLGDERPVPVRPRPTLPAGSRGLEGHQDSAPDARPGSPASPRRPPAGVS